MIASAISASDVVLVVGALAVCAALPALLLRRSEPRRARAIALLALLVVWFAAFDWPIPTRVVEPAQRIVVATGAGDGAWVGEFRRAVGEGAQVTVLAADGGRLDAPLAAAMATARDPRDVVVVWDGPFAVDGARTLPVGIAAFTEQPPAPVDPADVSLRVVSPLEVERPAALELALAGGAAREDARAQITIFGPDGAGVLDQEIERGGLGGGPARVAWLPASEGPHEVAVEVEARGGAVTAHGTLVVGPPPPPVLVVGRGAETVVAALNAQAIPARSVAELPEPLPEASTIIVLDAQDEDAQRRLDAFCDAGGGLVLVGGSDGGALPRDGAPLAAACPLIRLPAATGEGGTGAGSGDEPGAGAGQAEAAPDVERDPVAGEGATPPAREPDAEPTAPTGDTSAAQASAIEHGTVERRAIALVLVVDRSGSMGDPVNPRRSKMDFAKRSAYETARQLEAGDELGIVAFGSTAESILPLGPAPDEPQLRSKLERLGATDGTTEIAPGLEEAAAALIPSSVPIRHAVVITDGESLGVADLTRAQTFALRMHSAGVTVSVIQIASDEYGLVRDIAAIAKVGGGQFVRETDGANVPRLVFAEVQRALGAAGRRPSGEAGAAGGGTGGDAGQATGPATAGTDQEAAATESPAAPTDAPQPAAGEARAAPELRRFPVIVLERSPLLAPIPDGGFPDLGGVVPVVASPRALVLLATADGTPVLAFGHRGLGRVAAWAADWTGAWSERWREEEGFPARIATWVEAVRPAGVTAGDDDRLDGPRTVSPPAPTRAEWQHLTDLAGAAPAPLHEVEAARARVAERESGRAADLAFLALPVLLLLALVEWRLRR